MNESETLNSSFTIILAIHQPYSLMLHVTYVYIMQADLKPCLTFYPTYDWELAFHIYIYIYVYVYIYRERERKRVHCVCVATVLQREEKS